MSEQSPPPDAEALAQVRQEAMQLLEEILRAAGVPPEHCRALLARLQPPTDEGYNFVEHDDHTPPSGRHAR